MTFSQIIHRLRLPESKIDLAAAWQEMVEHPDFDEFVRSYMNRPDEVATVDVSLRTLRDLVFFLDHPELAGMWKLHALEIGLLE